MLKDKVKLMSSLNKTLFDHHEYEMSLSPSLNSAGPAMNVSERDELIDYLKQSKKIFKSPTHAETPLLDIYMKNLRLQEYQDKTNKYDLTQSKKLGTQGSSKKINTVISSPKKHGYFVFLNLIY